MSKILEWDEMIIGLMTKKPSHLPKHLKEYMAYAIDSVEDIFICERLMTINRHHLLSAYDKLFD